MRAVRLSPPPPPRPPVPVRAAEPAPAPLSHHEWLSAAAPFAAAGWPPDAAASDRDARRLAFGPREHAATATRPALVERLLLDLSGTRPRLERTLAAADGLSARAEASARDGEDGAALLARGTALPVDRLWPAAPGGRLALVLRDDARDSGQAHPGGWRITGAEARVAGLSLALRVSGVAGFPAEFELRRLADAHPRWLPEDLLAVRGRCWERLTPLARGWLGSVRLRAGGAARSDEVQARLVEAIAHLATTLAEPPARFHERFRAARWRQTLRGTLPWLALVGLVALAFALRDRGDAGRYLALLANVAPPLLMGLMFLRREMPAIGLPRLPRRPPPDAW